jgi:glycosyltransferase involved in cell wall biosynthesis
MSRKLVSVVTGTWQRHELLMGAIENIRAQTYRPLEHVIVSDGPDDRLAQLVYDATADVHDLDVTFQELGFWSSGLFTDSMSAAPFMVAQLLARGDYQIWWADDERALVPDHIEKLVDLLEMYEADFVYPKVEMTWPGTTKHCIIGSNPPMRGTFTHALYRRELLDKGMLFRTHVGSGTDADCLERVMSQHGIRWAYLPEVTFTHRVDK